MEDKIYIRCRNLEMTYIDPKTKFKIPRGKIVEHPKKLTRTMQKWVRRGGIKIVDKALYLKQLESEPKAKVEEKKPIKEVEVSTAELKRETVEETTTKTTTETPKAEPEKEPETKSEDKPKETQPNKPEPEEEQPKEKEEAAKPARKTRKPDNK